MSRNRGNKSSSEKEVVGAIKLDIKGLLLRSPEIGTLIAIISLYIAIGIVNFRFWDPMTLLTLARWFAGIGTLAIGESMALIIGGLDLSVGSLASLASMVFAHLITNAGVDPTLAFIATLGLGVVVGLYHGFIVTRFSPPLPISVPAFVATLGSLFLLRGIAIGYWKGYPVKIYDISKISFLASPYGGIVILVIIAVLTLFIQRYTAIGRYLYAIGGNLEAARVAGIPIRNVVVFAFVYSGACASLAGMIYVGLVASGYADIAAGQELLAIASNALAGVSLAGGEGNVINAILGAFLVSTVRTGIIFLGISAYWQDVTAAILLVLAVIVDLTRRVTFGRA